MKRTLVKILVLILLLLLLAPVLFIGVGMFFFIFGGIFNDIFQAVNFLAVGWIYALPRFLGGLHHEPFALIIGLAAILLLPVALHQLVICVFLKKGKTWRPRQSVAVIGILCCFTITTIAMIAGIHEIYWIAHPKENLTEAWNMGQRIDLKTGHPIDSPIDKESTP